MPPGGIVISNPSRVTWSTCLRQRPDQVGVDDDVLHGDHRRHIAPALVADDEVFGLGVKAGGEAER